MRSGWMRPCRESSCGGEHGGLEILAQFALGFGDAALGVLVGLAAVAALRDLADGLLRLLLEWASASSVRRSSSLSLAVSRFSHSRASSFSRRSSSAIFSRSCCFERLRLFDAAVQFAEEARDVALAVAHRAPRAAHDVLGHAEPRGDLEARRFARQAELQLVGRLEGLLVEAHGPVDHALGDAP